MADDHNLLPAFNFSVSLYHTGGTDANLIGNGGFAECGGLELAADIREHNEGGNNNAVRRMLGRVKLQPLVLKRGMLVSQTQADTTLWNWMFTMLNGQLPVIRYDGHIDVLDRTGTTRYARWSFSRGLPAKLSGPTLNARTGEIAIEELQIAHEGLRMEVK
jgi:phage tail-like protein